jgi:rhamnosyl/mannosyltransferase
VAPSEAFGLVQVEAMAAGLPVVNTDLSTTVPEVSIHGHTGLTVPAKNAEALAEALNILVGNEPLRLALGQAAKARALQEYSLNVFIERVWARLQDVASNPSSV